MAIKLVEQVIVMFLLMGIGIFIRKKGIVSVEAGTQFSGFVLLIVTPTLLVQVFQRDLQRELLPAMGLSLLLVIVFHFLAAAATKPMIPVRDKERDTVSRYGAICSNCGFMGIPLMTAAMGEIGMLYAAIYIGVFNVYTWTHGVTILRRSKKLSAREILLAPGTVGAVIGVLLFALQIRLPGVFQDTMSFITGMNTPLPMIITGVLIADIKLKELLTDGKLYFTSAVRLVILPLLMLAVMVAARVSHWFPGAQTVALAMMISCACPIAISTVMMPTRFGGDAQYGAKLVALSTLLSVVTIPLIASFSQYILAF